MYGCVWVGAGTGRAYGWVYEGGEVLCDGVCEREPHAGVVSVVDKDAVGVRGGEGGEEGDGRLDCCRRVDHLCRRLVQHWNRKLYSRLPCHWPNLNPHKNRGKWSL